MTESKRKLFNGQFTIGNLITILVVLLGLAVGYGAYGEAIEHNSKNIDVANHSIAQHIFDVNGHINDTRVHYMVGSPIETELKCLNEKLEALTQEVIKLRIALEKNGG